MSKNYYAVRAGREPGIYNSWADCKAQVDKFSGAQYKGFSTMTEAQEYLDPPAQDSLPAVQTCSETSGIKPPWE